MLPIVLLEEYYICWPFSSSVIICYCWLVLDIIWCNYRMSVKIKQRKCRLGENLDYLLKQYGMDIKNLSIAAGVPASTITRIRRQGNPTIATLEPLLDFFRLDMDSLLYADMSDPDYQQRKQSGKLTHLPVYSLEDIKRGLDKMKSAKISKFVGAAGITGERVFGVHITTQSLVPAFRKNSIAIVDPDLLPKEGDYVLCCFDGDETLVFRQVFMDGKHYFFKPVNPEFGEMKSYKKFEIIGVIIKSIESYR